MDKVKQGKDWQNRRFNRSELGELLKLFSSLGITVTFGITGSFIAGLYVERKVAQMGFDASGLLRIIFLLSGLALSIYWAYLRIAKHLDTYEMKIDKRVFLEVPQSDAPDK